MNNAGFWDYSDAAFGVPEEISEEEYLDDIRANDSRAYAREMAYRTVEIDVVYLTQHGIDPGEYFTFYDIQEHMAQLEDDEVEERAACEEWLSKCE